MTRVLHCTTVGSYGIACLGKWGCPCIAVYFGAAVETGKSVARSFE